MFYPMTEDCDTSIAISENFISYAGDSITKNVPDNTIAGNIPAKVIRFLEV